jgi:RNA polymerase sigma-70 factor (ECF subfamily)
VSLAEAEWLRLAQQNDENAFEHLVETYQKPVFNLCYRMLGNQQEAEDAAQEAFWRAYQAIDRYDNNRSFITWLLSITAHYCIDLQRKRRLPTLDIDLMTDFDAPDSTPGPETMLKRKQDSEAINTLLGNLKEQDRAIIILRYWQEFSEEEIARTLSLSVSAVKSRLHRARLQLANLWMDNQPPLELERSIHGSPTL